MQTVKEQAVAMISALPDDVSMEEIHNRLYVHEQIRAGLAELDAGEGIPHDAVEAAFAPWLGSGLTATPARPPAPPAGTG
jgi:predicted transcriptional regulator